MSKQGMLGKKGIWSVDLVPEEARCRSIRRKLGKPFEVNAVPQTPLSGDAIGITDCSRVCV
jgi:hypothetical protein